MTDVRSPRRAPDLPGARLWSLAQWGGVVALAGLLAGLQMWPAETLTLLWYGVVPLLPISFLVSTQIWRNVCPIATLNALTGDRFGERRLAGRWIGAASFVGLVLLAVLVPARRLLFNVDPTALGSTIAATGALALLGGLFLDKKGSFCNAVCPVLPVERLYGQSPLVDVPNARCAPCRRCTMGVCVDLVPGRAATGMLGAREGNRTWFLTVFGTFALAFPGFVIGYSLQSDVGTSGWATVYGGVALASVASWLFLAAVFWVTRTPAAAGMLCSAALAIGLYYWFTPASTVEAFGLPTIVTPAARIALLTLVAVWLARALRPAVVVPSVSRAVR